jgi:hypothetical protein
MLSGCEVQRTEIFVALKYTTEHEGAAHRNLKNGRVNMAVRGTFMLVSG